MRITRDPKLLCFEPDRLEDIALWARGYVDDGKLPCAMTLISRHGDIVFYDKHGQADVEHGKPLVDDTIFRIFSMTKPLTSVAAMILVEEGRLSLDDNVADYVPAFADTPVLSHPKAAVDDVTDLETPLTIRHLMTHTSGLTYGTFDPDSPLSEPYAAGDFDLNPQGTPLDVWADELAKVPLLFQPGSRWNYGVSTDLLGRVIEVIESARLDDVFADRIIDPLGLTDTAFAIPEGKVDRFATLCKYKVGDRFTVMETAEASRNRAPVKRCHGGGGLVSTMSDYFRFTEFLRRKGEVDGVRLLQEETIERMTANQIGGDIESMGEVTFSETSYRGVGFGLGFGVVIDPARAGIRTSSGEYFWGGAASTAFWIDPVRDITVIFMTQLFPSSQYPIREELRTLVDRAFFGG